MEHSRAISCRILCNIKVQQVCWLTAQRCGSCGSAEVTTGEAASTTAAGSVTIAPKGSQPTAIALVVRSARAARPREAADGSDANMCDGARGPAVTRLRSAAPVVSTTGARRMGRHMVP